MFGKKAKIRKAVTRALATVDAEDDMPELVAIEALDPALHGDAYGWLASELFDDERHAAARTVLERALAIAPDDLALVRCARVGVAISVAVSRQPWARIGAVRRRAPRGITTPVEPSSGQIGAGTLMF